MDEPKDAASADEFKLQEFNLKRVEFIGKMAEAAVERQFKLATFCLAGNVAAMVACAVGYRDYKTEAKSFQDATGWFLFGAILAAATLALIAIVSEAGTALLSNHVAKGLRQPQMKELEGRFSNRTLGYGIVFFIALYGVSGWAFFSGVLSALSVVK